MSPKALLTKDQRKMTVWFVTNLLVLALATLGMITGHEATQAFAANSGLFMAGNGIEHIGKGLAGLRNGG